MSSVIKVENLSKQYRLGDVGTGTFRDDFKRWRYRLMGKEDPFLKIGEENDRSKKGESDYVWALKDINFEVEQGDVVGIIGRNGAGKSTLLKILSRTTAPTTGSVRVKGRISSLLEVGTGFHAELSGRENIYLNGAIMGLRKWEIDKKLDEIIDFAGVDRYLDTPVKRYSSGMYVRLAFSVAAHLEPDILIVDEVLSVGDAEFQKKCLGKMKDVSQGQGRTVLFVSHQMDAVTRLCDRCILLQNGSVKKIDNPDVCIRDYLGKNNLSSVQYVWDNYRPGSNVVKLSKAEILVNEEHMSIIDITSNIKVQFEYEVLVDNIKLTPGVNLYNENGDHLFSSHDVKTSLSEVIFKKGNYCSTVIIPGNFLSEGIMNISIAIMEFNPFKIHFHENGILTFTIVDNLTGETARGIHGGNFPGLVRPKLDWSLNRFNSK
jgi:lipopolysaccharide transport system ATP-binding protein